VPAKWRMIAEAIVKGDDAGTLAWPRG